jgi:glycyl-tRNA synthetase
MTLSIEELTTFAKKKGFVFKSSDIYGGLSGFWDYGPLGVELFNNIKQSFWHRFVKSKENMVGIDASIISHSKVWEASGHLDSFGDMIITCSKCRKKHRADHLIEDKLEINVEGKKIDEINKIITENKIVCPDCSGELKELKNFNLMFETKVGATDDSGSVAYLRGETAQGMFCNFKQVQETQRLKLPFGIAQVGKTFRNEISPRDFMFRSREFTIAEFEFFIHPKEFNCNLLTKKHIDLNFKFLSAEVQDDKKNELVNMTINKLLDSKKLDEWHAYWLAEQYLWLVDIGLSESKLKIREHTKNELSHYSSATFDIDYSYPFGSKEIAGNANRGQYDLNQHIQKSKEKLTYFDEEGKEHVVPRVIEPTFGMDRVFLAILCDAMNSRKDEKDNEVIVLKLNPNVAPIQVTVLPLVNKLNEKARVVFDLIKNDFVCNYDKGGSIGRRYARADELGCPYCVTVDFDTIEKDDSVTIRNRDTMDQHRVKINDLKLELIKLLN